MQLWRNTDELFFKCLAQGHADFASRGNDIVCAAETILLRTAMQLLEASAGIDFCADTKKRGFLEFRACVSQHASLSQKSAWGERLFCIADFLSTGLQSLKEEYPLHIRVEEFTEKREQ